MAERPMIGAYFYPHVNKDLARDVRAKKNRILRVKNETVGSGYTIGGGITSWSDDDPSTIARQVELATNYGIGAFFVDAYAGADGGVPTVELQKPLDTIARVCNSSSFKFATMCSIKRPPTIIPYSPDENRQEPGRYFDLTTQTLELMVDHAAKYWNNPNYLQVNGRPLVGIYGLTPKIIQELSYKNISNIGYFLSNISQKKYRENPFFVAVVQSPILAYEFLQHGFEATTTYAGLPDFYDSLIQSSSRPIINWDNLPVFQNHQEQLARQMLFWESLLLRQGFRFYPSAVVGWDPIRRCEQGVDPEKAMPLYPYRPRMISTPDVFFRMLLEVSSYYARVPWSIDFPLMVATFNDVGDGTAALPRLIDGSVDSKNLEAIKRLKNMFDLEKYARTHQGDLRK